MNKTDHSQAESREPAVAVILAAGLGKRMGADLPKVLFPLKGRPLVNWVVEATCQAGMGRIIVVIGYKGELVKEALADAPVEFVWQHERFGTGHAVLQTEPLLVSHGGPVVILAGDVPLIRPTTIRDLTEVQRSANAAGVVLTAAAEDPTGYGRIVRLANGQIDRIVEDRDADDNIKRIKEINTGTYCFSARPLFAVLHRVGKDNAQGEYYLTDAIALLRGNGLPVIAHKIDDPGEGLGINSREQLLALENRA